jgi:hypothetical protein
MKYNLGKFKDAGEKNTIRNQQWYVSSKQRRSGRPSRQTEKSTSERRGIEMLRVVIFQIRIFQHPREN